MTLCSRPEHPQTYTGRPQVTAEWSGGKESLPGSSASLGTQGPLPGMGELFLARDCTPPPQLYFRPRRGEKAISWEVLTSMLGTG